MNVIYSIHKEYIDRIFSLEKNLEFRNRIGKEVKPGDLIYFYETKSGGGSGFVVGYAKIKDIIEIPYHKIGTYFMMPFYVEKYGTKEEKGTVKKAMEINLKGFDNSLVLSYLFQEGALDIMKKTSCPPKLWPKYEYDLKKYNEARIKKEIYAIAVINGQVKLDFIMNLMRATGNMQFY
ncbi:ASCH domain-containing protein [Lacrimispora amygdalina]|uniref:ASCH domain-containing protein n=1 Tax=Lacrimispora amygdalina TaxID=253257 RepID=UPI000BE3AF91|nr:ASCH domain-containing protein [Lacrimispora amygdalina]